MKKGKQITNHEIPELHQKKNIFGNWVSFFINRFRITILIMTALMVWGTSSYYKLPREVYPEIAVPIGMVLTPYMGASPEVVETLVTQEVELAIGDIEGIKKITSNSSEGVSFVLAEFESGVDVEAVTQKMREKVAQIQSNLPDGVSTPEVLDLRTDNIPIMVINVSGNFSDVELLKHSKEIQSQILKLKEVATVNIYGEAGREISILVDTEKMGMYQLTLEQIQQNIQQFNIGFPVGTTSFRDTNFTVKTSATTKTIEELGNIILAAHNGNIVYLKDIAKIEDGYKERISFSRMSHGLDTDNPSVKNGLSFVVTKKQSANITNASSEVRKALEEMEIPEGLTVNISGDMALQVENELSGVIDNAISGLFLVIVVLFLFIGFKESLIVSLVIPLSILSAIGAMNSYGITLNTMTLFAMILAVGMLVDNGIVIMENIDRLRKKGVSTEVAAMAATNQISPAILAATLTTVAAFYPIALTTGYVGDFIKPIPMTVIFVLIASFFAAITFTPVLSALLLKSNKNNKTNSLVTNLLKISSVLLVFALSMLSFKGEGEGLAKYGSLSWGFGITFGLLMGIKQFSSKNNSGEKIIDWYGNFLRKTIESRRLKFSIISVIIIAFVASIALIPTGVLKIELFTPTDNTRIYIDIVTPKGTIIEKTDKVLKEVENKLFDVSEIESFVSNIGHTGVDTFNASDMEELQSVDNSSIGRVIVELHPANKRYKSSMELAEELREILAEIKGADITVTEPTTGPPTDKPIVIRVLGNDLDDITATSRELAEKLENMEGTRAVSDGITKGSPQININLNKDMVTINALNSMYIVQDLWNYFNGMKAATLNIDQQEVDVMLKVKKDDFKNIDELKNHSIMSFAGVPVPLSQVAEVVEGSSLGVINREGGKRVLQVSADLKDGYVASDIINDFKEFLEDYQLPEGITIEYGGDYEGVSEAFTDMFFNMILAIAFVLIILVVQFNSISKPLIMLFTLPLALIGVLPGLVITGNKFGITAFIGIVALVGIVVNNAIVLIDYIDYLRKEGYTLKDAIVETGIARFNPIMATTVTTVGGILPITLKGTMLASMGYTIIFGLLISTILTLVVVPIIYSMFEGTRSKLKNNKSNKGKGIAY